MAYFLANGGGVLPITQGGTGASTVSGALTNLGIKTVIDSLGQTTSGKFVLPDGLKICWGTASTNNANGYYRNAIITFPVTFTSTPNVIPTKRYNTLSSIEAAAEVGVSNISTTGCKIWLGYNSNDLGSTEIDVSYIAIGY